MARPFYSPTLAKPYKASLRLTRNPNLKKDHEARLLINVTFPFPFADIRVKEAYAIERTSLEAEAVRRLSAIHLFTDKPNAIMLGC